MFPGMNKRQVEAAMKKFGMQQQDIDALAVVIRTPDKELIIESPQVSKINLMGQEMFQVTGKVLEKELTSEEDIKTVAEKSGASFEEAKTALRDAKGDLAAAIMSLKQ